MSVGHGRGFLGWLAGITAAVISGVLVVVLTNEPAQPQTPPPTEPYSGGQSIDFAITDQLGEGQISERISVTVNGRMVGTLTVDTVHTNGSVTVTLPSAGTYDYLLKASMVIEDSYGDPVAVTGYGTGTLQASNGRSFAVAGDYSTDPVSLSLQ
jgi:hypothetical protein